MSIINQIFTKDVIEKLDLKDVSVNCYHKHYTTFYIRKKSGKKRKLHAPSQILKKAQRQLLNNFLVWGTVHENAVGFKEGVFGVKKGAEKHLGCVALLTVDLKDFFDSLKPWTLNRIFFDLLKKRFPKSMSTRRNLEAQRLINNIFITLVTYEGHLPQGAPTSPMLSNLVMYRFDDFVSKWAATKNLVYTRYADDITISTKDPTVDLAEVYFHLQGMLTKFAPKGLTINKRKTRMLRKHKRMSVTGIVVNEKLSIPKWKWRNFKAKLHNILKCGEPVDETEYLKIKGYAEWIKSIHPQRGKKLMDMVNQIKVL